MAEPWYRQGLHFGCTRCGNCCRGTGTVRVSDTEISALARRLELSDAEFRAMYTRPLRGGDVSLRELRQRDCVFYDPAAPGCRVYEDRPRQCRSWPFWAGVVDTAERNPSADQIPRLRRMRSSGGSVSGSKSRAVICS